MAESVRKDMDVAMGKQQGESGMTPASETPEIKDESERKKVIVVNERAYMVPLDVFREALALRDAGEAKPVAWVEVKDSYEGPYDFHGMELLAVGKHLLYAAPETGMVSAPREPTEGLLMSMAIRYDHALGCPGYYDQPMFAAQGVTHAQRLESTLQTMRQLYEEISGRGFYSPEREDDYKAMLAAASGEKE